MPKLLAVAFHEAISVQRMAELFKTDWNQLFAGNTVGHCPKCRNQFAIFLPSSDDPKNFDYVKQIEEIIGNDCRAGKHVAEVRLTQG
jgi:hypothetical protein